MCGGVASYARRLSHGPVTLICDPCAAAVAFSTESPRPSDEIIGYTEHGDVVYGLLPPTESLSGDEVRMTLLSAIVGSTTAIECEHGYDQCPICDALPSPDDVVDALVRLITPEPAETDDE